jgi:hypothetical protein
MKFSAVLGLALVCSMSFGAHADDDLKSLSSYKLNVRAAKDIGVMTKSCGLALGATGIEGVVALFPVGGLAVKGGANHWQFADDSVYGQVLDQRTAEVTGVPADSKASPSWWAGAVSGGVITAVGVVLDGGFKGLISGKSEAMNGAFAIVIANYDAYYASNDSVCGQAYADFKAISSEKTSRSSHVAQFFKSVGTQLANTQYGYF